MEYIECPLYEMTRTTKTDYWNDSCSPDELSYAIARGAVGATTNPQIVLTVLKKDLAYWKEEIKKVVKDNPTWSEFQIAWKVFEMVSLRGAKVLQPVFEQNKGINGRLSIQTNPQNYRNAAALVDQAVYYNSLAPNIQVKVPVTKAGVEALEEIVYRGININATVSFTLPQAIAVAEAVERGLNRREKEGKEISSMHHVCTLMVGRLDDWLQIVANKEDILVDPGYLHWPGIAVFKRTYDIYHERGYRTRPLVAAYRHHMHWSALMGGDIVHTIPYNWQVLYNASGIPVTHTQEKPVDPVIINTLYEKFADFRKAYDPDGMSIEEFDSYGATVRTLRGFIGAVHDLTAVIRDIMLPNPDVK